MYGTGAATDAAETAPTSIESEINAEVAEMKHPVSAQLFTSVRIDVQCVVFFKTVAPIEPVSFVKRICEDALSNTHRKRTRYTKRLSPITLMGRATLEGVEKVARTVLEPKFHTSPAQPRKVRRSFLWFDEADQCATVCHPPDATQFQNNLAGEGHPTCRSVCGFRPPSRSEELRSPDRG